MRAIIIDDKDARELLDRLKLEQFKQLERTITETIKLSPEAWRKAVLDEIHGSFHFVVCRWLQDQGASVIRGGS